jgi:imidazolonepropionase
MPDVAIINCAQLVTLAGPARPRTGVELRETGIVEDGALLARDGRIEAAGARADIEPLISASTTVVDAGGRVVLPGFVDAHTHPVFAGNRAAEFDQRCAGATYEEIAAGGGGIRSTVRVTRAASEDELFDAAKRHAQWFLRCGTTTIEAKSGYGLTVDDELKILRVIARLNAAGPVRVAATLLGAHEIPDEHRGNRGGYLDLVTNEMIPRVSAERLAEFCDIFCEPSVFTVEETRRVLKAAQGAGLGLRVHADQLTNSGGALIAAELGALTADHLEQASSVDFEFLREAGVQPVFLPGSVYALGRQRYAAARDAINIGLAIVLATDFNPGSSPTPSMPMVLSLACTQMKLLPAEAITAATINAAYSLKRGAEIGSLEPGKAADFVIHDCADYREIPYWFGIEPTVAVYIGGKRVYSIE